MKTNQNLKAVQRMVIAAEREFHIQGLAPEENAKLRHSVLMSNLSTCHQDRLLEAGRVITRRKGSFLFMEGDQVTDIYYVILGKAREYFTNAEGEDCLRALVCQDRFISLNQLFCAEDFYGYSCEALTPLKCFAWKRELFAELVAADPAFACATTRIMAGYMEVSCRHNCLCRKTQAVCRVAGYLLSKYRNNRQPGEMIDWHSDETTLLDLRPLKLTAHELCLARETFSRALSQLQRQNHIKVVHGCVELLDIEALKGLIGVAD